MEQQLLKLLARKTYVPANVPELLRKLNLPANQQHQLQKVLQDLTRDGQVARIKGNRYILPREADLIPGRIQITRSGRGFLTPDDPGHSEIGIRNEHLGTAFHDDHVLVRKDVRPTGGRGKPGGPSHSGVVIRVLERRRTQFVGTLKRRPNFVYVVPDDPRLHHDIIVPEPRDVGRPARAGDKVVVSIREWTDPHTNPEGDVTEVLGPPTEEGVDMLGVLRQYELPTKFPRKVLQEVKQVAQPISSTDLNGRADCRPHAVITIDPDDAKDFDDAFYLEPAKSGQWKLWVHIADVTHYVKPDSALDQEARKRGNSTYLVDRVIPMLPEALSNELCSLKPEVDRLTRCVEFLLDDNGQVLRSRCYAAVIHSQRRFTYKEALGVLEGKAGNPIEKMLQQAHRLAQKIRRSRFKAGSLNLDFPETKIRLDDRGRVARIEPVVNDVSHQLIEEFMLLANEAVASKLMNRKRPAVYRIHEPPNEERLGEYRQDVLSHGIPCGNLTRPAEVQKLLARLGKMLVGPALKIGFLKSLMRARYAVTPLGHYGLAKTRYTHFTSPIRRYADLLVHRCLFEENAGSLAFFKQAAAHVSTTERNSSDAERDSKHVKLYAFLEAQLKSKDSRIFPALVTDLRNFGFFVDVSELGMSGLVPLSGLKDDFYEFSPERNEIRGRRTRQVLRLGDTVEVQVAKVDTVKKQVDFQLVPKPRTRSKKDRRPSNRPAGDRRGGQSRKKKASARKASRTN